MYLVIQHIDNNTPTATYNGDSITHLWNHSLQSIYFDIYEIAAPDAGTYTIQLTYPQYVEYQSNIPYWVIPCTDASGYGGKTTANGLARSPGINCNVNINGRTGSAIVMTAALPNSANYNQTLTIDGTSKSSAWPQSRACLSSYVTGWYKEDVSTGNTNAISQYGYNMGILSFEIKASATSTLPTVITQAVSNIGRLTATGNGNITSLGSPNPTAHGICWDTSSGPTIADSSTNEGSASSTGAFTSNMTGLNPGTLYYVKAYATNTAGTAYGGEVTFTTKRRVIVI